MLLPLTFNVLLIVIVVGGGVVVAVCFFYCSGPRHVGTGPNDQFSLLLLFFFVCVSSG